jgi:hypothetical protein
MDLGPGRILEDARSWGVDVFGLEDYNGGNREVKRVLHG